MRTRVLRSGLHLSCQLAALGVGLAVISGCSSDVTRFDRTLYARTGGDVAAGSAASTYTQEVDALTTSAIDGEQAVGRRPIPSAPVSPRAIASANTQEETANGSYSPYQNGTSAVARSNLPNPVSYAPDGPLVASAPAHTVQHARTASTGEKGWSSTGGTAITLREGETLYSLSRRYGVPVKDIMRANSISDPNTVQAGMKIIIPTYVYSPQAPVSAPDNSAPTAIVKAPEPVSRPAGGSEHVVAPGDTLASIARRNGATVDELMAANRLSSSTIRVGQKLTIPGKGTISEKAPVQLAKETVPEPKITKAVAKSSDKLETQVASLDTTAPQRTGISEFRWPVRGRVISAFGEEVHGNRNDGIDISVPEGTAIKAAENGVVVYAGDELEGFGNLVLIRHSDGWVSAYAHAKSIEVKRGDEVRRGEIIARAGRSGDADTPKLHFELRKNSTPMDPMKHLSGA